MKLFRPRLKKVLNLFKGIPVDVVTKDGFYLDDMEVVYNETPLKRAMWVCDEIKHDPNSNEPITIIIDRVGYKKAERKQMTNVFKKYDSYFEVSAVIGMIVKLLIKDEYNLSLHLYEPYGWGIFSKPGVYPITWDNLSDALKLLHYKLWGNPSNAIALYKSLTAMNVCTPCITVSPFNRFWIELSLKDHEPELDKNSLDYKGDLLPEVSHEAQDSLNKND